MKSNMQIVCSIFVWSGGVRTTLDWQKGIGQLGKRLSRMGGRELPDYPTLSNIISNALAVSREGEQEGVCSELMSC